MMIRGLEERFHEILRVFFSFSFSRIFLFFSKSRDALGVHHGRGVLVGLFQVVSEVTSSLVDLPAMAAHIAPVGLGHMDLFEVSED